MAFKRRMQLHFSVFDTPLEPYLYEMADGTESAQDWSLARLAPVAPCSLVPLSDQMGPPGQMLPFDALYHLFCVCMEHLDDPGLAKTLSLVCSTWRHAAIHTPALWKYVRMDCIGDRHQLWPMTQLVRGKCAPIVFELFTVRDLFRREVDIVMTHAYRFKKFVMHVTHPLITTLTMKFLQMTFPILEEFEYVVNGDRRLTLSRNVSPDDPYYLPLVTRHCVPRWEQWSTKSLTSLSFAHMKPGPCPTLVELHDILESCRNTLQHFKYHGLAPDSEESQHPVTLLNLQSLSIGYADDIQRVVELVYAPSLKSLEIRDIYVTPESPVQHPYLGESFASVTRFPVLLLQFTNAFPELTSLELWGINDSCNDITFSDFLFSFPKLRKLVMYGILRSSYFDVLYESSAPLGDMPLFPQLDELTVSRYRGIVGYLQRRALAGYQKMEKLRVTSGCMLAHKGYELGELMTFMNQTAKTACVVTDPAYCDYSPIQSEVMIVDGEILPSVVPYQRLASL